ncbi:uncharacterized protein BCR38DRAFT_298272, partial [Pseudomassariella vexata]
ETAILQTSRHIYAEAKEVMLKGNQFGRITSHGVHLKPIVVSKQIPVITTKPGIIASFNGFSMTHDIRTSEDAALPSLDLMILGRDLDLFCQGLARATIITPKFSTRTRHAITIHKYPFETISKTSFLDLETQKKLLHPYRQHLHGFSSFKIGGYVSPQLAQAVVAQVNEELVPDPQEFFYEIVRQKDLGNRYFRENDGSKASETWCKALFQIHKLCSSNVWPKVKAKGGPDFANTLTELCYQLNSNRAQHTIRAMIKATDSALVVRYSGSAYHAINSALGAPNIVGTKWRPTPQQQANLSFNTGWLWRI